MTAYPDIPTALTAREADYLAELATDKVVLEVGSQYGFSTVLMARTARLVVAVDHHLGDRESGFAHTFEQFWDNVLYQGMGPKVIPIVGDWRRALSLLNLSTFGLVFFDAEHDTRSVCQFLVKVMGLPVSPIIAVHDYGRFGVKEAVDDRCRTPWINTTVDTLAVLRCG